MASEYFGELKTELEKYIDADEISLIEQAYHVAEKAHQGQKRFSGEPYITHPIEAATILAKMRLDYQTIMATLLHDVLEDSSISKEELAEKFGDEVAVLVDGVSKLTQIKFETHAEAQAENFRKMILAMSRDIRVFIVKLADRLHNMRTLGVLRPDKQRRIAIETLEIYAPIAHRLGMHDFYVELEDLGFKALYPLRYRVLNEAVDKSRRNRKQILSEIEETLKKGLKQREFPTYRVIGRQKHLYSIYKKMRSKRASFAEIMDVYGFRIVVDKIDTCYRVLGLVHKLFKPRPERFKDYIALPKSNGYQSLHTTLFGPYGVPIEVQIRSGTMDKIANLGVAAHWIYKESKVLQKKSQPRAQKWVNNLMEMQKSAIDSLEFIETVKIDLFPEEIYVFTPKGEIKEFPRGATAVDFAYAVHSDIGNSCVAVKIDHRLAPLSAPLRNGQRVEIITAPGACPNPAWLNFVVTGKARSNIRHFLKGQQNDESISLGKRLLESALNAKNESLSNIDSKRIDRLVRQLHFKSFDELAQAIGLGNQVAPVIAMRLSENETSESKMIPETLVIKGTEGMVVKFATCCRPIPGDCIVGSIQPGQGIVVHVESCPEIATLRTQPDRIVIMRWEDNVSGEFKVDLRIEADNRRGVLALLASEIADAEANIDSINVDTSDGRHNRVDLTITVRDRNHLARLMRRLRAMKSVVFRISRSR